MSAFYFARNGQQSGPMAWEALVETARAGGIYPTDLIWADGWPQWFPAAEVEGLSQMVAAQGPPAYAGAAQGWDPNAPQSLAYAAAQSLPYSSIRGGGQHDSLATTSMWLGIVSLIIGGPFLSIPGLICGWIALNRMKRTNDWVGKGKAIAGVTIGALGVAVVLLVIVVFVILGVNG